MGSVILGDEIALGPGGEVPLLLSAQSGCMGMSAPAQGCVTWRHPPTSLPASPSPRPPHRVCFLLHKPAKPGEKRENASPAGTAPPSAGAWGAESRRPLALQLQLWVSAVLGVHPPALSPPPSAGHSGRRALRKDHPGFWGSETLGRTRVGVLSRAMGLPWSLSPGGSPPRGPSRPPTLAHRQGICTAQGWDSGGHARTPHT